MKSLFEKWRDGEPGTSGLGSFTTQLFRLYWIADNDNGAKLREAFPEYFLPSPKPKELDETSE